MPNRTRKNKIAVYLSDEELVHIGKKLEAARYKNREAYMRKMVLDGYILQLDLSLLTEAKRLLATATNNINQIAKKANESKQVYDEDIQGLQTAIRHMKRQINEFVKVCRKLKEN